MKLFITHIGLNSYIELSNYGVPAIVIPIFADQYYNSGCAVQNGVALRIDKNKITETNLINAIDKIFNDKK